MNAIEPGKRMLSAMTPTIVLDETGALLLVVGAPGGATIITTVFQVISNVLDHGLGLADAVAAPRVHHQHLPDRIEVEPDGLPETVVRRARGEGPRGDRAAGAVGRRSGGHRREAWTRGRHRGSTAGGHRSGALSAILVWQARQQTSCQWNEPTLTNGHHVRRGS